MNHVLLSGMPSGILFEIHTQYSENLSGSIPTLHLDVPGISSDIVLWHLAFYGPSCRSGRSKTLTTQVENCVSAGASPADGNFKGEKS